MFVSCSEFMLSDKLQILRCELEIQRLEKLKYIKH